MERAPGIEERAGTPAVAWVVTLRHPGSERGREAVAVEEPLEIRVNGSPLTVTMRTPGDDGELAVGFLLSEGIVPTRVRAHPDLGVVEVDADGIDAEGRRRNVTTTSACGVCGTGSLDALPLAGAAVLSDLRVAADVLTTLPDRLRRAQPGFTATGGTHATAVFDSDGTLLCAREDVGRHNAFDKVVGWAHEHGALPLARSVICVSGRLSFELVHKCATAGAPVLVGVGAPSTLAVRIAEERGVALCGFVREGRMTVYAHARRLT